MEILDAAIRAQRERDARAQAQKQEELNKLKARLMPAAQAKRARNSESRAYAPLARQVIAKARASGHGDDLVISGAIFNLQNLINNVDAVQTHLKEFDALTTESLNAPDGALDPSAVMRLFSVFSARFAASGGVRAMKKAVALIESRVARLESSHEWEAAHGQQRKSFTVQIPATKTKAIKVVSDFDARQI